mmetsp:Transcript_38452/g.106112  ORF Transcript_38452/g.106112 Transcript_38452/m.106112 type:complete len:321 (-) Transcript_38452:140-1102(-)
MLLRSTWTPVSDREHMHTRVRGRQPTLARARAAASPTLASVPAVLHDSAEPRPHVARLCDRRPQRLHVLRRRRIHQRRRPIGAARCAHLARRGRLVVSLRRRGRRVAQSLWRRAQLHGGPGLRRVQRRHRLRAAAALQLCRPDERDWWQRAQVPAAPLVVGGHALEAAHGRLDPLGDGRRPFGERRARARVRGRAQGRGRRRAQRQQGGRVRSRQLGRRGHGARVAARRPPRGPQVHARRLLCPLFDKLDLDRRGRVGARHPAERRAAQARTGGRAARESRASLDGVRRRRRGGSHARAAERRVCGGRVRTVDFEFLECL